MGGTFNGKSFQKKGILSQASTGLKKEIWLTEKDFQGLLEQALDCWTPLSRASRNRKIACLKSFCKFLMAEKILKNNLAHTLKAPKVKNKIPRLLSYEEIKLIVKKYDIVSPPNPSPSLFQDKKEKKKGEQTCLFLLLYGSGLKGARSLSNTVETDSLVPKMP